MLIFKIRPKNIIVDTLFFGFLILSSNSLYGQDDIVRSWKKVPLSIKRVVYHLYQSLLYARQIYHLELGETSLTPLTILNDPNMSHLLLEDKGHPQAPLLPIETLRYLYLERLTSPFTLSSQGGVPNLPSSRQRKWEKDSYPNFKADSIRSIWKREMISHLEMALTWASPQLQVPLKRLIRGLRDSSRLTERGERDFPSIIADQTIFFRWGMFLPIQEDEADPDSRLRVPLSCIGIIQGGSNTQCVVLYHLGVIDSSSLAHLQDLLKGVVPQLTLNWGGKALLKNGRIAYIKDEGLGEGGIYINPRLELVRNRMAGVVDVKLIYPETVTEAIRWEITAEKSNQ